MPEFKIGDKVRRVSPNEDHDFWNEPEDGLFHGNIYTVSELGREGGIKLQECRHPYSAKYFELVETTITTPLETYTTEQLSYISELEDRVEYLESLCSDLAEHIEDVEYKLEQHSKALSKWFKLTQLVSENNKVADLIGARLGDNVNDIIYDYLLSRVK